MNLKPIELTLNGSITSIPKKLKICEILIGKNGYDLVILAYFAKAKHLKIYIKIFATIWS